MLNWIPRSFWGRSILRHRSETGIRPLLTYLKLSSKTLFRPPPVSWFINMVLKSWSCRFFLPWKWLTNRLKQTPRCRCELQLTSALLSHLVRASGFSVMAVFKSTMTCGKDTRHENRWFLWVFLTFCRGSLHKKNAQKSTKNNPKLWKSDSSTSNSFKFLFFLFSFLTLHPSLLPRVLRVPCLIGLILSLYLGLLLIASSRHDLKQTARVSRIALRIPNFESWHPWHPLSSSVQKGITVSPSFTIPPSVHVNLVKRLNQSNWHPIDLTQAKPVTIFQRSL